jgi:hypothetical protein
VHPSFGRLARSLSSVLLCAAAFLAAGCHNHNQDSGFGLAWVTITDSPGDFAAYQVNIDSVTLTGKANGVITAVGAVETVDFTKLKDISELWSSASIPNDTYTSASITIDYTSANIAVIRNGVPVKASVIDPSGAAVTTQTVTVNFDASHPLVIVPTYASTSAQRLALSFDVAASNVINLTPTVPTVTVKPFMTAATSAPDTKPVRVRGPLINSSVNVDTYTVYVRPFFDEINSLGSLTMFTSPTTLYQLNGKTYVGQPGITALSQTSAGTTVTAAYTTFEPTPDVAQNTSAGKFNAYYVVAGSTLEDFYTQGLEGDVVARKGNLITLRGATLQLNDGTSAYYEGNSQVIVGSSTIVTAEENTTLTGLDYNSISVGQHIIARGIYELPASGIVTLDATGSSSTNTGSVRLQSTQLFGTLVSAGAGNLVLDLDTLGIWPANSFVYEYDGAGATTPSAYQVSTGSLALPAGTMAGSPLWINGFVAPFGTAPPDFLAASISAETAVPAHVQVDWPNGAVAPFVTAGSAGLVIDLANTRLTSALIRVGAESIDMKSLPGSPTIVPHALPAETPPVPAVFLPLYSIGSLTSTGATTITSYNTFATFLTDLSRVITGSAPALHLVANGVYNRASNTFTASSIDVVN